MKNKFDDFINKYNLNNKLMIILFCFFIISIITGVSYAYFSMSKEGGLKEMSAAILALDFSEGENEININPAIPTPDENGLEQSPYTFTVTNNGQTSATYKIELTDIEETHEVGTIPKNLLKYSLNESEPNTLDTLTNNVLDSGIILSGATKEYRLRIWLDYSATNEISGMHYHAKIKVSGTAKNIKVYGIRRKIENNSSSHWERIDNNEGLVANAIKSQEDLTDGVRNDFNNIYPWSGIKSYNYDTTNNVITAWIGDQNYKANGSNGEVLTYIPEFYYRRYQEGGYEYISITDKPYDGYIKSEEFSVGRYKMSEVDSKGHSKSGSSPSVSKTITEHRNLTKEIGEGFGQMDYRYFVLQMLYLVEYADYNSQSKLGNGITSLSYENTTKSLLSEESTNRILISKNFANEFILGQQIDIGTTLGDRQIAAYRTITEINTNVTVGDKTGTEIVFDGSAVNVALGNIIYSCGQNSGQCDSLGMLSGCLNNDGKHSIIYRGIEDIFGNVFEWVDGLNIRTITVDNMEKRQAYISYNPATYAVKTFTGDYKPLGYYNSDTDGYAKTLGYDANNPLVSLVTSTGGKTFTYVTDYYFQTDGNRVVSVGGSYYNIDYAGLWYWNCIGASSDSGFNRGTRILKYN